jgi:hypothetical protein
MSRSRRKTKVFGSTTSDSEKQDKRIINRALRSKTRAKLKHDPDTDYFPVQDDVMGKWEMSKDGKGWWKDARDSDMRK